jgi:hypothetical protein
MRWRGGSGGTMTTHTVGPPACRTAAAFAATAGIPKRHQFGRRAGHSRHPGPARRQWAARRRGAALSGAVGPGRRRGQGADRSRPGAGHSARRKGVASFRFDRRGVGDTPGDWRATGFFQHRQGAAAVLRALAARPEVGAMGRSATARARCTPHGSKRTPVPLPSSCSAAPHRPDRTSTWGGRRGWARTRSRGRSGWC